MLFSGGKSGVEIRYLPGWFLMTKHLRFFYDGFLMKSMKQSKKWLFFNNFEHSPTPSGSNALPI